MPFDQSTRNRLARFVGDARAKLTEEFTRQLQQEYGLDPVHGEVTDLARLSHLDDSRRATALLLRETLDYYLASQPKPDVKTRREMLERIVREQAFTILNRLCALRMAESRGLLIESVGLGYRSKGFQLYSRLAGTGLGETGDAYRWYLFSLFDELAVDLPALFDRYAPEGRLFPREAALLEVLALINAPDITPLWTEDETIGWVYQYFNSAEERRQMRAESQAPRNSRELAVRNQFFTPRYVVEFLTDNTLGRIWYEMTQGNTGLKESCRYLVRRPTEIFLAEGEEAPQQDQPAEDLTQEELLRQPVHIPHRSLKDPRDIKMLDPACGSMHFGLYAFDLYERIYAEAWEMQESSQWPVVSDHSEHRLLTTDYSSKAAFLADVPRLIVEHNIHGIDIDPRAVQIAGLSLWLRAQRSWQAQGLRPQERPAIQRSHIVCAEPMPGNQALLDEFLASLRADRLGGLIRRVLDVPATQQVRATARMADALCDLVRLVWDEMKLAGEAGSLLKIEETLANAVRAAEREWSERMPLFRVVEFSLSGEADRVRYPRSLAGEDGADFWQQAEALVLAALQDYAEQAQNGAGYQRRLFAADAARGFAFVDTCRKSYDVTVMNPPFGWAPDNAKTYQDRQYPNSKNDLYCAFVERLLGLLTERGRLGSITSRTAFFLSTMRLWREAVLLQESDVCIFADLGFGVLDNAFVETASFVLEARKPSSQLIGFYRVVESEDKASALEQAIRRNRGYFLYSGDLQVLPGSPFSYWISQEVRQLFAKETTLQDAGVTVAVGLATSDNERFLRTRWEIPPSSQRWKPYPKGGDFAKFHQDVYLCVDWDKGGEAVKAQVARLYRTASRFVQNTDLYFLPGFTYPRVSVKGFGVRVMPAGCIFSDVGLGIFPGSNDWWLLLGILNSDVAEFLMRAMTPSRKWEVGFLKQLPLPRFTNDNATAIAHHSRSLYWSQLQKDYVDETAWHFIGLCWPQREGLGVWLDDLHGSFEKRADFLRTTFRHLNAEVLRGYGLDNEDLVLLDEISVENSADLSNEEGDTLDGIDSIQPIPGIDAMMSYLMGCLLGRWDVGFATGAWSSADVADPFDPLPICPPGMLQNAHGLPAAPADVPADYPMRISWAGILVDDPGHPEDIEARVRDALRVIWPGVEVSSEQWAANSKQRTEGAGSDLSTDHWPLTTTATADAIEQEACQILGVGSLGEYFAAPSRFFGDHLKRYSKSRRQAPIYWPLSTRSGGYTLWLYYHRLSDQMLYTCVNDFIDPKLAVVSGQLAVLRQKSGRSREEERELEGLTDLEIELKDFRAELLRIAAFWRPNLNDGVQITAAPLWRLFQHRPWQKTLKETWEKLEAGEYDWAHLAMSIWPERVVPKCVTDRSLAIAHDVENLFWVEDPEGKWRNLRSPDEEIANLVDRQRSPARARLRDLLGELGRGRARGLRCAEVAEELSAGRWDDLEAALLLWPQRVAERCWDDPLLAVTLQINLPAKRTKAARERWVKERVAAGCPDLAGPLAAAFDGNPERFATFWAELARGDHDDLALALALWPERVVDKCARDVQLADRHNVRRFLWVQDVHGMWRQRKAPRQELSDEITRRQN